MHVLLIDDDAFHARLIRLALQGAAAGVTFEHLPTGAAFRRRLADRGFAPPDLLLLDLRLRDCSGLDLLRELRQARQYRDAPVVVLTTSNAPADRDAALELKASEYCVKPTDFHALRDMMTGLAQRHLTHHRGPPPPA